VNYFLQLQKHTKLNGYGLKVELLINTDHSKLQMKTWNAKFVFPEIQWVVKLVALNRYVQNVT
jgi:hypothetical protein